MGLVLAPLAAAGPAHAGLPQTGPVPEFTIPVVRSMPELDGELDDACWQDALVSSAFYPAGATTPVSEARDDTTLYVARSGHWLLVALECRGPQKEGMDESVTVHVDPLHCHEFAYEFWGHRNEECGQYTWADPNWVDTKGHWAAAVSGSATRWAGEMRINLMHLPYLRSRVDTIGLLVTRQFGDESRVVWALHDTEGGLTPWDGYDPFWACHVRGLDISALIAATDRDNAQYCAPLAPRVEALREAAGRVIEDTSMSPERRLKGLLLATWAEDLDPKRRHYVELVSVRGLEEREMFLQEAEALASLIVHDEGRSEAGALARLASSADGPGLWEVNVARPISRFRGRSAMLSVSFAGLPLGAVYEQIFPNAEIMQQRLDRSVRSLREAGLELRYETRGDFDVCVIRRPGGEEDVSYATRGLSRYDFEAVTPAGERVVADALLNGKPFDESLAEELRAMLIPAVTVDDLEAVSLFPPAEAALVVPPDLERDHPGLARRVQAAFSAFVDVVHAMPEEGSAVVVGTPQHDALVRAAGFRPREWANEAARGHIAIRPDGARQVAALWGREPEEIERAARVLRDTQFLLSGRELLVGDLHAHSVLSDGSGSPRQVLLACMAAGMDFAAITDHNTVEGSLAARVWCDTRGLGFTAIRGEEVLGKGFEVLALGIRSWVSPQPDPTKLANEVRKQGGLALLCHVGYPDEETGKRLMEQFESLGLDGIDRWSEGMADHLNQREMLERRPVVTEVTDAHELAFGSPYRTLVFASDSSENGILEAIRDGYYVTLSSRGISGAPRLVDVAVALIAEGDYLCRRYRQRVEGRLATLSRAWREGAL
jgi:hypothetical protein